MRDDAVRLIANMTPLEDETAQRASHRVWGEGVEPVLPEVDNIVTIAESQQVGAIGPWDRVSESAGHRMGATECHPPRWMVRSFPTQAEIESIGLDEM